MSYDSKKDIWGEVIVADFSLDLEAEKIYNNRTKEYFREVISSYINGHYRSAIVMLYSVVISDLVFKLKELVERDDDEKANEILTELNYDGVRTSVSSDWEMKIVEKIFTSTNLLEKHEYVNIDTLKSHRNLCAHPVLNSEDILYSPNKETARAHIRNMLEGVLVKPPMYSKQVIQMFIENLPEDYKSFHTDEEFERYIEHRYFRLFNKPMFISLFRTLWKFVFKLNNDDCNKNRSVNFQILNMIFKKHRDTILQAARDEKVYYSQVEFEKEQFRYLVEFLADAPQIYSDFTEDALIKFNVEIKKISSNYIKAWYINNTIEKHLDVLNQQTEEGKRSLHRGSLKFLRNYISTSANEKKFCHILITYFSQANSFNDVDYRYTQVITPFLRDFKKEHLDRLLDLFNSSPQFYNLYWKDSLISRVVDVGKKELDYDIDLTQYEKLK